MTRPIGLIHAALPLYHAREGARRHAAPEGDVGAMAIVRRGETQ
jgi:hypothetical protein